jgi:hypothetical protein
MAFQIAPVPNLTVQQQPMPDILQKAGQAASLRNMLSETELRSQLAPLDVQEAQEKAKQAALATQQQQMQIDSQRAMMASVASGELNKYAGTDAGQEGSGFDAAGAYQHLMSSGKILPEHASQLVTSFQTIDKNNSEIQKNKGAAQADFLKNRADSHEQVAEDLADLQKVPPEQQAVALAAKQQQWAKLPGLDPNDKAILAKADPAHFAALSGLLDLNGRIEAYHAKQTETTGAAAGAEQKVRAAAPPTPEQLTNAVTSLGTYAAVPQNMRVSLTNEMKAAPDYAGKING